LLAFIFVYFQTRFLPPVLGMRSASHMARVGSFLNVIAL
jgi:hypothetical protein